MQKKAPRQYQEIPGHTPLSMLLPSEVMTFNDEGSMPTTLLQSMFPFLERQKTIQHGSTGAK